MKEHDTVSDDNVNETVKSLEQNAKRMTLKYIILLYEI